jgi:hypothetical protein
MLDDQLFVQPQSEPHREYCMSQLSKTISLLSTHSLSSKENSLESDCKHAHVAMLIVILSDLQHNRKVSTDFS